MNHTIVDIKTASGTIGGTLLSVGANIDVADVSSTVLLASIGAVVSFSVSLLLKYLVTRYKRCRSSRKKDSP